MFILKSTHKRIMQHMNNREEKLINKILELELENDILTNFSTNELIDYSINQMLERLRNEK